MYIPKNFITTDTPEVLAFMQQYSFATIITANSRPTATHLPLVVSEQNGQVILSGHFAKANAQWEEISTHPVLVIFSEPHAYISPKHYEKELSVPTWNYISVHAYGQGRLVTEPEQAFALLENMITTYEADYKQQWDRLPSDFKSKMLNGIVSFEITVTELQAAKKLSQNKTTGEKQSIINAFAASTDENERQIGHYMEQMLEGR
jgi:transcriptional regulator